MLTRNALNFYLLLCLYFSLECARLAGRELNGIAVRGGVDGVDSMHLDTALYRPALDTSRYSVTSAASLMRCFERTSKSLTRWSPQTLQPWEVFALSSSKEQLYSAHGTSNAKRNSNAGIMNMHGITQCLRHLRELGALHCTHYTRIKIKTCALDSSMRTF